MDVRSSNIEEQGNDQTEEEVREPVVMMNTKDGKVVTKQFLQGTRMSFLATFQTWANRTGFFNITMPEDSSDTAHEDVNTSSALIDSHDNNNNNIKENGIEYEETQTADQNKLHEKEKNSKDDNEGSLADDDSYSSFATAAD